MPTIPTNSGIRDNHTRGTVADFLKGKIQDGSRLSVVSANFTIYAYDALKDSLDRIEHLNCLFGEPSFVNRLDPSKTEKKAFVIDADGLTLAKTLQQKRVAKECAEWIRLRFCRSMGCSRVSEKWHLTACTTRTRAKRRAYTSARGGAPVGVNVNSVAHRPARSFQF